MNPNFQSLKLEIEEWALSRQDVLAQVEDAISFLLFHVQIADGPVGQKGRVWFWSALIEMHH